MDRDACSVKDMHILHITECLSLSFVASFWGLLLPLLHLNFHPVQEWSGSKQHFWLLLRCTSPSYRFQQWICPCAVRIQQVALFYLPSFLRRPSFINIHECAHTTGLSVLSYFSVCGLRGVWLTYLVFTGLSAAVEASTLGSITLHRETKFIIGFDFAATLSSTASSCVFSTSLQDNWWNSDG